MGKYLKKFETQAAYEAAQSSLILPNVSLTVDNNTVHYNPSSPVPPTPTHDYVEIAGIKWATMNVGAESITDYGNYYQFGKGAATYQETSGDTNYEGTEEPLAASADTVVQTWGGNWRMPTISEFQVLGEAVNSAWTVDYQGSGVAGIMLTDKTDNSKVLFFPACGAASPQGIGGTNEIGYYISSTSYDIWTFQILLLTNNGTDYNYMVDGRDPGYSVRGVLDD